MVRKLGHFQTPSRFCIRGHNFHRWKEWQRKFEKVIHTPNSEIKNQVAQDQEKTVFVKGDKDGPYGPVMEFVDKVKVVGGVKYVALATQKRA